MSIRLQVMIVGVIGAIVFLAIGSSGLLPWVFAGPIAATFVTGWILTELREYLRGRTLGESKSKPKPEPEPKLDIKPEKEMPRIPTVSIENPSLEQAVTILPKSYKKYQAVLRKGEQLILEAGADDWIRAELVSRTESRKKEAKARYDWERGKDGKNITIEYEAKRNGNWFVYVYNEGKTTLEVGVTLTVEEA